MRFLPSRLALLVALLLPLFPALARARAAALPQISGTSAPPVFLSGTGGSYPDYTQLNTLPVGKTLILPVVISGSGPMTYTATSSNPALLPIIKTGYPVMNIQISYSGTTTTSGTANTLYTFTGGNDGGNPQSALIQASDGFLFGTTLADGTNGFGTIYRIATSGSFATLYSFAGGNDGAHPYAPLFQNALGNIYGTAETGGTNGAGTIYQFVLTGTVTALYSFTGGADGGNPQAGVVGTGTTGILYGTTTRGGAGGGTIFSLTTTGTQHSLSTLYSFTGGADGGNPQGELLIASDGNLYGTTADGGISGDGTLFKLTTSGSITTLHTFTGGADGAQPYGGVIQASDGNLYGTTTGGTNSFGTVFQITTGGSLTTLHSFTGGADGANPYGGLIQATDGNLYGTTESGTNSFGTVFQISTTGSFATLCTFTSGTNGANPGGANPYAGLIQATDGNLYGTTETSGSTATSGTGGFGTVFQLSAKYSPAFTGTMGFALFRDTAPVTTGYIAGFAQAGYYTGADFFRITSLTGSAAGFIAQAGDPTNTGTGSPGFAFDDELNPSLIFTGGGQLAMANSGVDTSTFHGTNGSQFFFTGYSQNTLRFSDFNYTIFGQLLYGFDTMSKVLAVTTGTDGSTPTVPVVMNSVTISEDNTDAILMVSAAGPVGSGATITINATDPGKNKAVTPAVSGTVPTIGHTITLATFNDVVNDPPIVLPDPNVFASLNQKVTLPIVTRDLEFDYLSSGASLLSGSSGGVHASGNVATVTPSSSSPIGGVSVGLYVTGPYSTSNVYHETAVSVGLGTGKLTGTPALLTGGTGSPLASSTDLTGTSGTPALGSFLCSDPNAVAADFTASINWGDGTPLTSSTNGASVVKSTYRPGSYSISSTTSHSYSNPGIYPLNVTVSDTNGGLLQLQDTAVVSNSNIYAFGRTFTAAKGSFDGLVATFVDRTSGMSASDFQATINWGDGAVAQNNGIIRGSHGTFQIYGKHKYTSGATYPVDVTITSSNFSHSGYAWSIAKLTGVPTRQPPFAQSHIIPTLSSAGYAPGFLDEQVTLYNSGNIPSGPVTLKFYLYFSNTAPSAATLSAANPIPSGAIQLQVGANSGYTTPSISPGASISGVVSDIFLPSNAVSGGLPGYIIMQVVTSDPIAPHMDYPHAAAISE